MMLVALLLAASSVTWVAHEAGTPMPADAVRVAPGQSLYVCRAKLPDGVHSGVTDGGPCLAPQKGVAQAFVAHEVATGLPSNWRADDWDAGVVTGTQGRNGDMYVCRARVTASNGKTIYAGGKAYRTGNHAGHCYVVNEGREVDIARYFELLVVK